MNEMIDKLNKVLIEKNFGNNENELILTCFKILNHHFSNKKDKLLEYIKYIESLTTFKIVTDINESKYLKNSVKPLHSSEEKSQNANCLSGTTLFKKIGENYILSENGDYVLNAYGKYVTEYDNKKINKIIEIWDLKEENIETFLHEYEHITQEGFIISSMYFSSAELMLMLKEGDAMDFSLSALKENKQITKNILMNNISYVQEYHFFTNLKIILGEKFIDNWKKNNHIDFMEQVRNIFKEKFNEEILQDIISIIYFLSNVDNLKNSGNDYELMIKDYKTASETCLKDIEHLRKENESIDIETNQLSKRIMDAEINFNNNDFINRKINIEELEYNSMIEEYSNLLNRIKKCNGNKDKIREFILSLGEVYNEKVDYEAATQKIIDECYFMLQENRIGLKIKGEVSTEINNLKYKLNGMMARKNNNNERISEYTKKYEIYNFSIGVISKVIDRCKEYSSLISKEENCFALNMILEIELLFNECINKLIESSDTLDISLGDYNALISSAINISRYPDSETGITFVRQLELMKKINVSRIKTQQLFASKSRNSEVNIKELLCLIYLNKIKSLTGLVTKDYSVEDENKIL